MSGGPQKGPLVPGVPPYSLRRRPSTSAGPGRRTGSALLLSSLEQLCYFQMSFVSSWVLSCPSSLPCPSHPEGRVVVIGLLCLWWALSDLVYKEAGLLALPSSPLSFLRAAVLMGFNFPLWNRLFGGYDAPVGLITSQRRAQVLRPCYLLPASSLPPSLWASRSREETFLYVPGCGQ